MKSAKISIETLNNNEIDFEFNETAMAYIIHAIIHSIIFKYRDVEMEIIPNNQINFTWWKLPLGYFRNIEASHSRNFRLEFSILQDYEI